MSIDLTLGKAPVVGSQVRLRSPPPPPPPPPVNLLMLPALGQATWRVGSKVYVRNVFGMECTKSVYVKLGMVEILILCVKYTTSMKKSRMLDGGFAGLH